MATIYDIAARAGVSPATVSRVMNGKKTNTQNYERVITAAQALGYHRIAEPQSVAERKNILLVPGRNTLGGFYAAARELGYSIQLVDGEESSLSYIRKQLASGAADGLITGATDSGQMLVQDLSMKYPVVTMACGPEDGNVHRVWVDVYAATKKLIAELERNECHRVWLCGIDLPILSLTARQIRACCAENSSIDILETVDNSAVFFSQAMGDHILLAEKILSLPKEKRPDGLVMGNSVVASCLVNLLRIRGMHIPEELAVVSVVGGEHDRACEPYLTSILPPYYELGYEAVRVLDHLICGRPVPEMVSYPYKIHYGGSTRKELGSFGELIEG